MKSQFYYLILKFAFNSLVKNSAEQPKLKEKEIKIFILQSNLLKESVFFMFDTASSKLDFYYIMYLSFISAKIS